MRLNLDVQYRRLNLAALGTTGISRIDGLLTLFPGAIGQSQRIRDHIDAAT